MAYIYQIINNINNKIYVGKTTTTIQERWKYHIGDSHRERCKQRPLYRAMNKYGVENFSIQILEQCSPEEMDQREMYWINKLQSYHNGYNATLGGDGSLRANYDLIVEYYKKYQNLAEVSRQLGYDTGTIKTALLNYNIPIKSSTDIIKEQYSKKISQLDLSGNYLRSFESCRQAGDYIIANKYTSSTNQSGVAAHIGQVCNGKRKTAYGFQWKKEQKESVIV